MPNQFETYIDINGDERTFALIAGWGHPKEASKLHFYRAGSLMSLCNRSRFNGYRNAKSGDEPLHENDCQPCARLVPKYDANGA